MASSPLSGEVGKGLPLLFTFIVEANAGSVELVSTAAFTRAEQKTMWLPLRPCCLSEGMTAGK